MDREQIIRDLNRWAKNYDGKMTNFITLANAIGIIEQLTEENERLRADVAKEFTCVFGKPHRVSDCPITDEIAKAKADTVRQMQERLMQKILENTVGNDSFAYFLKGYIDQIAKEIEEGKG